MPSPHQPSKSIEGLGQFLRLPAGTREASWELVTLPDSTGDSLPGPTDYVALIAVVEMEDPVQFAGRLQMMKGTSPTPVQPQFIRPWLSTDAKNVLRQIGTKAHIWDASTMVMQAAKRAFAIPIGQALVIYVEYVSP